jgi:hypothetical protein
MPFDPKDPDTIAALATAIEDATAGLKRKNDELLGEVKKLKKGREIDPEDFAALERERDELQERAVKAEKEANTAKKAIETATKNYESETAFTSRLLVENGLREALLEAGVKNPVHAKAVMAMMRNDVKIVVDGENRIAKVGEKDLKAHVKEWSQSDEGKQFIAAPDNSGSGAHGSGKPAGAKTINRLSFEKLSPHEQMAFSKEGGTVTD